MLLKLLKALRKFTQGSSEATIEANPESIDQRKLSLLVDNGINRISIGIQSFNDPKLKIMERAHNAATAKKSVELAHKKGLKNINIDLIFGVRPQTLKGWKRDLSQAVNLPVKHISCYGLDCRKLEASDEVCAGMYGYTIDFLRKEGFEQYEISNFARKGFRCRHNLTYWDNEQYIGLGPSAVSYVDGRRYELISGVDEYIKGVKSAQTIVASSENLKRPERAKEAAAVKIRTMQGISFGWFKRKTNMDFLDLEKDALPGLIEDGLIEYVKGAAGYVAVRLTRKGILFCDIVSSAFL